MSVAVGQVLNDRYRIDRLLGQGGMGAVYRAWDSELQIACVVKENLISTASAQRQFAREAKFLSVLQHPHIPRIWDYFAIQGQGQYLVMGFIEGEDLGERLERENPLPVGDVLRWADQILDALDYLHQNNVIHRDIKPANIRLTPDGSATLVDFGIAKEYDTEEGGLTTTGARGLTPGYAPFEQYGHARTDARTDVYALGATLCVLLTSEHVPDAISRLTEHTLVRPVHQLNPNVSVELSRVIEKALALMPPDRYQTASDFRTALRNAPLKRERPQLFSSNRLFKRGDSSATLGRTTPLLALIRETTTKRGVLLGVGGGIAALATVVFVGSLTFFASSMINPATAAVSTAQPSSEFRSATSSTVALVALAESATATDTSTVTSTLTNTVTATNTVTYTATASRTATASATPTATYTSTATLIPPTPTPSASPTPVPTPFGGGGGHIAFVSDRDGNSEIYIMNLDGSGQTNLTQYSGRDEQPQWSPDGKRIAFVSERESNLDIYVMDADGRNLKRLTDTPGYDGELAWSPNGLRIAFTSRRDGNYELYVMNSDGSNPLRLTDDPANDRAPVWSPDGGQIAFVSERGGTKDIFGVDLYGNNLIQLTDSPGSDVSPTWSPDGSAIVFASDRDGDYKLYRMNATGDQEKFFAGNSNLSNLSPEWSPDGRQILYCGSGNFFLVDVNSQLPRRIAVTSDSYPGQVSDCPLFQWSPDSKAAILDAYRFAGGGITSIVGSTRGIYLWVDGGTASQLTNRNDTSPVWQP